MDERTALLYSKLNTYKALVNKTSGFIRWALSKVKNPYVACSFGKDSAVMLHLCLQQRPDIPVIFVRGEETDIIDNYNEVISKWGSINLYEKYFYRENLSQKTGMKKLLNEGDFDSYFVGLRKEESTQRRISLLKYGLFHEEIKGKIRIAPISDWKTIDIEAYSLSNELPILDNYKFHGFNARTSSGVPSKGKERMLLELKQRDINAFNKLLKLLPDARNFI